MMSVTALFATAGATNAGLYPAPGLCEQMASTGQFPPLLGRRAAGRVPVGLLLTALIAIVLSVGFDLSAIASIGSAIALLVFALITVGHFRVRDETGANPFMLGAAVGSASIVLVVFALTTLVSEPATVGAIVVIIGISVALDLTWKRTRLRRGLSTAVT
jgi:L-asparagine transporter-like permease